MVMRCIEGLYWLQHPIMNIVTIGFFGSLYRPLQLLSRYLLAMVALRRLCYYYSSFPLGSI